MAYDLKAVLRLQDKLSAPLKRATKSVEQMNRATQMSSKHMGSLGSQMSNAANATRRLQGASQGASDGILSMYGSMIKFSVAMGMVTATAAPFIGVMKSIQEAAKFEQSNIQIKAMFQGDIKSAQQYMDNLQKMAVDSPLLNSQDMLANSKSFIGQTRNLKTLNSAWKVAEKLMAWSPEQSVESVVFAMRELASGDAISMVERFELPRSILNDIKKLKFEDQLKALDKLMAKFRITDQYIEEVGSSAISLWNQIKERSNVALREIGEGALQELKPVMRDIIKLFESPAFDRFKNSAAKGLATAFRDITTAAKSAWSYIERTYINNDQFQKLGIQGKISFLFDDVYRLFKEWLKNGGQAKIDAVGKDLMTGLAKIIENNATVLASAGISVGVALGRGILTGFVETIKQSPWSSAIMGGIAGAGIGSVVPGVGTAVGGIAGVGAGLATHYTNKVLGANSGKPKVEYNGSTAMPGIPSPYKQPVNQTNNNSFNFKIDYKSTGATEKDADALLNHMAKRIKEAGGLGAGGGK